MNPQLVKLLGLLAASGMVAAPVAMIADKQPQSEDNTNLDVDSEEAQMRMAELDAEKNYEDSPAHQDKLRQLEALRRLKNR